MKTLWRDHCYKHAVLLRAPGNDGMCIHMLSMNIELGRQGCESVKTAPAERVLLKW
jgi:hypothetical protein